jgi:glycosyltransferase involved in cell wall biosynthesis
MKLLTIAIPTFNRAGKLDVQLAWLANAIKGFENEIEIFVSDNCSTDNTQEIISKWKNALGNVTFRSSRNSENIGVMRNIGKCLTSGHTKYVWAVGDDDPIQDRTIPYVIEKFKKYDDLSLLLLNFSGRDHLTGEEVHPPTIIGDRWFDIESEDGTKDGKLIFEHCITKSVGSVIFLTAAIYRTDLLMHAARMWPDGAENWMYLAYLSGYCAANGRTIVSKENYLVCVLATSYWQKDPRSSILMQYKHVPEVVRRLAAMGYSKEFYRSMMVRTLKDTNIRVLFGAFRRWPAFALKTLGSFLTFVGRAAVGAVPVNTNGSTLVNISTEPTKG